MYKSALLGAYVLMGDYYNNDETSETYTTVGNVPNSCILDGCGYQLANTAPCHALRNILCPLDNVGLCSSVNDIFSHILALSSHMTQRFLFFIENLVLRDVNRHSEDLVAFSGCQPRSPMDCTDKSAFEDGPSSSSPEIHENRSMVVEEELLGNARFEVAKMLTVPLLCLKLASKFAVACWRLSLSYIRCTQLQLSSIMSRVQRTLHGSSDDIGWLQCNPDMAPVEDGTSRFLEVLEAIRNGEHRLPNSFLYLLIPGLFSNHGPLYFVGTKRFFSKMGLTCHIAKIHSEASVEHNAWELKQYIEELYWGSGKRVMLLGHSKGGVDAAAALSMFWDDLKGKVAGLALVQSPYGGTPVASDILREGQIADKETRRIMELIICKLIKGDIRALEDLTYEKRKEFILKNKLPDEIPFISFHSEASIAPGVLATMTHIAHAELPWLPLLKFGSENLDELELPGGQVPVAIPLSAAMAVCALHLQLRYGEKSDGVVTCRDAEVPGSVVIRPDRKLDHAWMVYSSRKKNPSEPNASEMCEAILTLLVEIGVERNNREKGDCVDQS
ncbi:hypothetical protein BT93_L2021 [Corymbia citriodora subsp. variegata]|uniref:Alpha/beta-Hydrolases superfamily protein n=2 Tax=Corymbia citriodora subsp. variegata TaxID=360336 RepID=A0A8T0CWQ8_CORYI|nr:hypothetical protein BT93_L2021 [Corymbia citriodora subsp. variegata]